MVISAVIPTLDEARNIGWVLERMPPMVDELILVDGRSKDGTIEAARAVRPDIRVVMQTTPGKGAALRAGFEAARGAIIVMLDADGSMHPGEVPRFVACIEAGYDLVKGSRFIAGGGTVDISRVRAAGNFALLAYANRMLDCRFTELCYGFMALRREALPRLGLTADGFEIETQIVAAAVRANLRIAEVPSFESARRAGASNLRTFRDGSRVLRELMRVRRTPLPLAIPPSALATLPVAEPEPPAVIDAAVLQTSP